MKTYKKEITNNAKTKKIIITRCKLSDGYNYYFMVLCLHGKIWTVNNSVKQTITILSEKTAITEAKKLIKVI